MVVEAAQTLVVGSGAEARRIAMLIAPGAGPAVVWLGGFRSEMTATKASAIAEWGRARGRRVVRFDYSGHGASGGDFREGTISRWLEESLAVIRAEGGERPLLVGSSMGGWLALLAALALAGEGRAVAGLVLIAPAVDFTQELMWDAFPEEVRREILERGAWLRPSDYAPEPVPITRALIEDGRRHALFGRELKVGAPVAILQGLEDPDVPPAHARKLAEHLAADEVTLTLIPGGDHRLSRPQDIERLMAAIEALAS